MTNQANNEVIVSMSNKTRSIIADTVKLEAKVSKNRTSISEALHADGFTGFMLMTKAKGGNEDARKQVSEAILAGFTQAEFALLSKDAKSLNAEDKIARQNLMTRKDTTFNRIRGDLFAYDGFDKHGNLIPEQSDDNEADEDGSVKTDLQKIHAALDSVLTKLQKLEDPNFDVVECVKRINAAKGMIPSI